MVMVVHLIPRTVFGRRGSTQNDRALRYVDRLTFDPSVTLPPITPDNFGGRREYTPLKFCKHMPSRAGRGGE
jgi:hypothetical protein